MKKVFLVLLCLLLIFLSACNGSSELLNTTEMALNTQENNELNNVDFIDSTALVELYEKNKALFTVVKDEISNMSESVYLLRVENKEINVIDSNGVNVSVDGDFNDKNIVKCICLLEQFASYYLGTQYEVRIYKKDFGIEFNIRDFNNNTDYCVVFSEKANIVNAQKIEGNWYLTINGLV